MEPKMKLELPQSSAKFVEEQVRRGAFSTPEDVIVAALATFQADCEFGDFTPGALDALLADGERSGEDRGWFNREDARRELIARLERLRISRQ
jgi:Arc/MetJ-type ribon-helix-helix transcriptional regulator